jgi:hypothetical protein
MPLLEVLVRLYEDVTFGGEKQESLDRILIGNFEPER